MTGLVETVPPGAACDRSAGARRSARLAKAARARPIVGLRVVSAAGVAAREGLTAKRARPEMAAQRVENVESAPGIVMAGQDSNHYIWRPAPRPPVLKTLGGSVGLRLTFPRPSFKRTAVAQMRRNCASAA